MVRSHQASSDVHVSVWFKVQLYLNNAFCQCCITIELDIYI
jgi:hypothetical protein